jgi:hypothetical protein
MLPGAVIAAQGTEIVFAERLDAGFGIDLGGREISLLQFDDAVSASVDALEWPQAPQIGIMIRSILILRSLEITQIGHKELAHDGEILGGHPLAADRVAVIDPFDG